MALNDLPPEVILHILSYLPLSNLTILQCLSRSWSSFFVEYESTIYRQAALLHGFIHDATTTLGSKELESLYSQKVLKAVNSWTSLCQARIRVRNAWNGVAQSKVSTVKSGIVPSVPNYPFTNLVHRIKVDEQRGFVIVTSQRGGLFVLDMQTGDLLWGLSPRYVRGHAHLEYSNGYLVFDRIGGDKEVWRLVSETMAPSAAFDPASSPDAEQLSRSIYIERPAHPLLRGCFEPHAVLRMSEHTTAFRLAYPTLQVAAYERVYLWDVVTARVVEVIDDIQPLTNNEDDGKDGETEAAVNEDEDADDWSDEDDEAGLIPNAMPELGPLRYVDHSSTHVFLAGSFDLRIFRRFTEIESLTSTSSRTRIKQLALTIPSMKYRYGRWRYSIKPFVTTSTEGSALVRREFDITQQEYAITILKRRLVSRFVAVHVSPCGLHFAALLTGSRLLIVPHFKHFVGQPDNVLYDNILDIQLASPRSSLSIYLAYEGGDGGEGRIGVVTTSGVFVLTLPLFSRPMENPPEIKVSRVSTITNPSWLAAVSCLMLSDTGIFINWDVRQPDRPSRNPWQVTNGDINRYTMVLKEWDDEFEESLGDLERLGDSCYEMANGDMFVAPNIDGMVSSPIHRK